MKLSRGNRSRKKFVIGVVVVLIAIGATAAARQLTQSDSAHAPNQRSAAQKSTDPADAHPDRVRLIATGDFVFHDSVNANAKQRDGSYDYSAMMQHMEPLFAAADLRFCNQVTPAGGTDLGIAGYPKFNAPTEAVRDIGALGCNLVNMASNHSFDKSQAAINANVSAWEQVPGVLAAAGQNRNQVERDTVHMFTVKGVKFAFLAYTTYVNADAPAQNNYGVNRYSRAFAAQQITQAKEQGADIIIASMRWGTEYSPAINAQQTAESQYLADQGVDVILGHGPHVLQPVKKLARAGGGETYVWYSLGNFLNTQIETEALFNGLGVVDFSVSEKRVTGISYLPIYMHYEWSVADARSQNLMARTNLGMYTFDDTTPALIAKHQLNTSVAAQTKRIADILNQFMEVPLLTKAHYLR